MKGAHAVVVLPAGAHGHVSNAKYRAWLSRGDISLQIPESEMLVAVLSELGAPCPEMGLAALRFWGQTGDRSTSWMAAADPVHLEARLRDLRIRSFAPDQVSQTELRSLFDTLQAELGADDRYSFTKIGTAGYLHSKLPIDTPSVSSAVADGHVPDRFTPSGSDGKTYHQLLGELQMLLHDHEVNIARQRSGQPVINSLWFWGGGVAPDPVKQELPDLYSSDPLFIGYWASHLARVEQCKGFGECLANSPRGFVTVASDSPLEESLRDLKLLFGKRGLQRLTLLFGDGLRVSFKKTDRLRFWRDCSPLLEERNID